MRYTLESELEAIEHEFEGLEDRNYRFAEAPTRASRPAAPASGAASTAMRPVGDTTQTPFRWICRIRVQTAKGHSYGSGILISQRHVLTAAHVIYPPQEPYATTDIEVGPGYSASSKPRLRANGWAVDPRWKVRDCKTVGADIGLIRLEKPVSQSTGFWNLAQFTPSSIADKTCLLAGYPARPNDPDAAVMFKSNGRIRGSIVINSCTQTTAEGRLLPAIGPASLLIGHDCDSVESMSGGPICLLDGGIPKVVAVHTGTVSNGALKKAVLLTQSVQTQIRDWTNGSLRP